MVSLVTNKEYVLVGMAIGAVAKQKMLKPSQAE